MSEGSDRFLTRPGERRILRAVAALGTATVMLGGVGVSTANAAPSTVPASSVVSPPETGATADAEIEAIKQLKASYFANVDAKNWSALRELLAPNVVVDTTGSFGPIFFNRDTFIAFTALTLAPLTTHHEGYDPQITLTSPTTAEVVWTMQDRLVFANIIGIHGYGHYTDTYEKVGDTWVVEHSKLTRTALTLMFPGLDRFNAAFAATVKSEGPVVALVHAVRAFLDVNAPFSVTAEATDSASAVSTAISPTNAQPANVPATVSTKAFTLSTPASTGNVPAAKAKPVADAAEAGTHEGTKVPAEKHVLPVTTANQGTDAGERDPVETTSEAADAKGDVEPKTATDGKDGAEPKKAPKAKVDVEPKKTADAEASDEPKKTA
jgi:hypothetical protein